MCGIAGVIEFEPGCTPSVEGLQRMAEILTHRGPDECGVHRIGPVGLAHRRLSIIDLVDGQQPMQSPDGQVHLAYNGELYNYPELRDELEQRGYLFRTRSDTEVLLALYCTEGLDAFSKIDGMFACALWDGHTDQLVLARDRFGKKPLFYYQDGRRFLFGSEIKALLAYGGIERKSNVAALHEYLSHGYAVSEQTMVEGVYRLPPAHLLVLRNRQVTQRPYWHLAFEPDDAHPPHEAEVIERLEILMQQAVRRRLMSDVPLGAFLSGGLDSSTIVAFMAQLSNQPVRTFTIGFEETDYSELEDARVVARHLGTDHHEMVVKASALDILPDLVWYLDEPFGDSSAVPTYYVCREARRHVTVALSGDGGDEVFAGYRRYQELGAYQRMARAPGWLRRGVSRPLTAALPFTWPGWNYLYALGGVSHSGMPCTLGLFPYIQSRLYTADFKAQLQEHNAFKTTEEILKQVQHLDPVSRYQYLDTLQYLPGDILTKVDRMSMANSLEVRAPLLDTALVEYVATLPIAYKLQGSISKYIFRKLCGRMLPPSALTKHKQGFAIPMNQWLQSEIHALATEFLLDSRALSRGYFRENILRKILQHHTTGQRDYSTWIWSLIVLEMWFRKFIDYNID